MTDFAEGDKVVLIDSPTCTDDWSDVRGTVTRVSEILSKDGMVQITPVTPRPDGFGLSSFFWDSSLLVKEEW